jgi:hypothetical protein
VCPLFNFLTVYYFKLHIPEALCTFGAEIIGRLGIFHFMHRLTKFMLTNPTTGESFKNSKAAFISKMARMRKWS